jgi:hypothetical protein
MSRSSFTKFKEHMAQFYMTSFSLYMFSSTICSTTGGVVTAYSPLRDCGLGYIVAPLVLQAFAFIIGLSTFVVCCKEWISSWRE